MRDRRRGRTIVVTSALCALWAAHSALAEETPGEPAGSTAPERALPDHPMLRDRYFLSAGVMYAQSNVTANLNSGRLGLGSIIDFEDDLGLDEWDVVGVFQFRMRFAERWRLEAEYFNLDRDHERPIDRTIDWGNLNVPTNSAVHSTFNFEDFRVSVGYSFFKSKDKEIGVGLGAHVMDVEAQLSTRNFGSQRASESAPLPVLTMYARIALTDRWLLSVRVDRLSLDTGDIDGSIFSSGTEFVYQPWRHFNIGLGYRDINMEISSSSESWRGKAQVRENGPVLFFSTTF